MVDGIDLPIVGTTQDLSLDRCKRDLCYDLDSVKNIKIYFVNKEPNDTKIQDNKIVEDLLLIVDQLSVDGIDLINDLSRISVYQDLNNTVHRTYNYITFNGCMTIKIHKNLLYNKWLANHC